MSQLRTLTELNEADCRTRLRSVPVGRLGYVENGVPVIRPVNFYMLDESIWIWTVPGSRGAAVAGQTVAFQIDQIELETRSGWTVLVSGPATAVTDVDELVAAADFPRRPWAPERNDQVIKIRIDHISGLRLPPSPAEQCATSVIGRAQQYRR
ncbi:pyridoxamine 5'-phosphate oxidase family protein [Nocardia sp. NPDC023852]|uniref:pyridoxamine 5'-phosphate oxidase family protein n=1 Tax=Nocardia sp. NPDC023852 TaxID=3154697 RepID=UPI0033FE79BF